MQRIKTFLSDGSNPNGRWFATDANAIQDAAAALTDLTQHVSVADLAIGESSLLLSRYGAGQAQLAGNLRVASGVLPGVFTTTQRDNILAGKRPTGMIIFNSTTNQLEINLGSDTTPSWQSIGRQAPTYATTLPGSPVDGQEVFLVDSLTTPTYAWHLRYNGNSGNTDRWEFIGGAPIIAAGAGTPVSITVPRAGMYEWSGGGWASVASGGDASITTPGFATPGGVNRDSAWSTGQVAKTAGQTIAVSRGGTTTPSGYLSLAVRPVRLS